jgi:hypothetical protein
MLPGLRDRRSGKGWFLPPASNQKPFPRVRGTPEGRRNPAERGLEGVGSSDLGPFQHNLVFVARDSFLRLFISVGIVAVRLLA